MKSCRLVAIMVLAVYSARDNSAGAVSPPTVLDTTIIVTGIDFPTTMAFIGHCDFLVLEQRTGKVIRVKLPGPSLSTVLQLNSITGSEQGMLGIALHPDFTNKGWVYFYHTDSERNCNQIVRYWWDGNSFISRGFLISFPTNSSHNGGIIAFGPDGKLYAVVGDTRRASKTTNNATAPLLNIAQIVRLNDDGSVPSDNPFTEPGWEKIYAYGIRNSFGFAFDPQTGCLWDTENGPASYDEINIVRPGFNSGWDRLMGPLSRIDGDPGSLYEVPRSSYADPVFSWAFTIAPTAIRFLNSPRFSANLRNNCIVGNVSTNKLFRFPLNEDRDSFVLGGNLADGVMDFEDEDDGQLLFASGFGLVTDLQIGPDGYLYVVSHTFRGVFKIRPRFPMGDINRDQNVTDDDMPLFFDLLLGNSADPLQIAQADFDGDGIVTGLDIQGFVDSLRLPN